MEIVNFEIVDLGVAAEGTFDTWGAGFNRAMNSSVLGEGPTARKAIDDALDQLALEGFGTQLLHASSLEAGFMGTMADTLISDITLHLDEEDEEPDPDTLVYHIGIRFNIPEDEQPE